MKVILTGATGFLGSHILKGLFEQAEVIVLKRSFSKEDKILKYQSKYKSYDIDKISLYEIFEKESKIDAVIHCATDYGRKNDIVGEIFQSNVVFPLQLLEIATLFNVDTFINTDTFFGKTKSVKGYMQNYILTKNQFLDWGKSFAESGKINFINMRLEHIYGENDNDSKFIPLVIQSCLNNVDKIDLTDGEQYRDFIYINDVFSAYLKVLLLSEKLKGYEEFEIGTGMAVKVKEFVNTIKKITKSKIKLNYGVIPYRQNEIIYSQANTFKLKELGWDCKYDIEKGIETYLDKLKNYNLNRF